MLKTFARWFASAAGVVQTFVLVGALVILESTHMLKDDHGFWLLYWLTVYSAVTQPLLAYANKQDAARSDATLTRIEAKEDAEINILTKGD